MKTTIAPAFATSDTTTRTIERAFATSGTLFLRIEPDVAKAVTPRSQTVSDVARAAAALVQIEPDVAKAVTVLVRIEPDVARAEHSRRSNRGCLYLDRHDSRKTFAGHSRNRDRLWKSRPNRRKNRTGCCKRGPSRRKNRTGCCKRGPSRRKNRTGCWKSRPDRQRSPSPRAATVVGPEIGPIPVRRDGTAATVRSLHVTKGPEQRFIETTNVVGAPSIDGPIAAWVVRVHVRSAVVVAVAARRTGRDEPTPTAQRLRAVASVLGSAARGRRRCRFCRWSDHDGGSRRGRNDGCRLVERRSGTSQETHEKGA